MYGKGAGWFIELKKEAAPLTNTQKPVLFMKKQLPLTFVFSNVREQTGFAQRKRQQKCSSANQLITKPPKDSELVQIRSEKKRKSGIRPLEPSIYRKAHKNLFF